MRNNHIPRLREEGTLRDFLDGGTRYRLCWVAGEKGSGKTEIVKSVAGERDDTLYYAIQKWDEEEKALILSKAEEYRYIILDNADSLFPDGRVNMLKDYVRELAGRKCTLVIVTDRPVIPRTFSDGVFLGSDAYLRIYVEGISEGESRTLFPSYDYIDGTLLHAVTGGRAYLYGMLERDVSFRENIKRLYRKRSTLHSYFRADVEKNAPSYTYAFNNTHFYRGDDTAFIFYLWYLYPVTMGVLRYEDADDFWERNREDIYTTFLALTESGGMWAVSSDGKRVVVRENGDATLTVYRNSGRVKFTEDRLHALEADASFLEELGFRLRYSINSYYGFEEMEKRIDVDLEDSTWKRVLYNRGALSFGRATYALSTEGWKIVTGEKEEEYQNSYARPDDKKGKEIVLRFRDVSLG